MPGSLRLPVDVVHAPSLAVPPVAGSALVVTVNDVAFLRHPEVFTRRGVAFHRRGLDIARRRADLIVTPSEFVRRELVEEGFGSGAIVVAPHGVTAPRAPGPEVERRVLARAGPPGWLHVEGIDGPEVRRLGPVDEATLDVLYRRAAACAMPSLYEGFGLPALEAMARGCPLVVSDAASLPEVTGDTALLADPHDVDTWERQLGSMLDDPAGASDRAARARRRAEGFSWERSAGLHLRAYTRAMQNRTGDHL